jgi:hypothetical protein
MGWSVLVSKMGNNYSSLSIADLNLYDLMKESLSEEDRGLRYGMKFVAGKRDIPDEIIDSEVKRISGLVERMNRGEIIDLEKELA